MEETAEAVAVAVSFLGETVLQSSADRLVDLANAFPFSGIGNDTRHQLIAAAAALFQARFDAARRLEAVALLEQAASALEHELGLHVDALRVAAADLAHACRDHRAGVDALEMSRCAPAPRMEERRPWWSLLRWCRRAPAEDNENQGCQPFVDSAGQVMENSAIVAAEYLAKEVTADHLVEKASNVMHAAAAAAMDHDELDGYVRTLKQDLKNGINSLSTIELIGKAATKLEHLASSKVNSLRMPAVRLVCACQEYHRVSNAMMVSLNAASKLRREQAQRKWWRLWG